MFDIMQWSKDEELSALLRYLTQNDYPQTYDRNNMLTVLEFLSDNEMLKLPIIQKLSDITYTSTSISIDGVAFSRENLTPVTDYALIELKGGVKTNEQKTIFSHPYKEKKEYYYTTHSYLEECERQSKKPINKEHLLHLLTYLPGKFTEHQDYLGGNILGILLNLNFSGGIEDKEYIRFNGVYGCLVSGSTNGKDSSRAYGFNLVEGGLFGIFSETFARPGRRII